MQQLLDIAVNLTAFHASGSACDLFRFLLVTRARANAGSAFFTACAYRFFFFSLAFFTAAITNVRASYSSYTIITVVKHARSIPKRHNLFCRHLPRIERRNTFQLSQ
jgi:hypothetical protein